MVFLRGTERSYVIDLISEMNNYLQNRNLSINNLGGEANIAGQNSNLFPDVILFGDQNKSIILQGWEVKLPDTPITDQQLIQNATIKANALNLNSFFLWNFSIGVLYIRNDSGNFDPYNNWVTPGNLQTRLDVENNKANWVSALRRIILDINEFVVNNTIIRMDIELVISESLIPTMIKKNKDILASNLSSHANHNTEIESKLRSWWNENRFEFSTEEVSSYSAYAKVILLNWVNRFLFANLIKYHFNVARRVETITDQTTIADATILFENISSQCDFFNILSPIEYCELLTNDIWIDLLAFNEFLRTGFIETINNRTFQSILEEAILLSKREIRGQFSTPDILARLLTKITIRDWGGEALDPCCGTGTIVKSIIHEKSIRFNIISAYNSTWASDKHSFPLQISTINLANIDAINLPIKIFRKDVFNLHTGDCIEITNPTNGQNIRFNIPLFESIISNLPFIEFEKIDQTEIPFINEIKMGVRNSTGIILSARNDIYSYIIFHLHSLLQTNGRLGLILSNSWLGTTSGIKFRQTLMFYFNICQVVISGNGNWFDEPKVVTTLLILEKKEIPNLGVNSPISFCVLRKNLVELDDENQFNCVIDSSIQKTEINPDVFSLEILSNNEVENLTDLGLSWNAFFHKVKWVLQTRDKLSCINNHLSVIRGERRGWDPLFYPTINEQNNIEEEYLRDVLKNSRSLNNLNAQTNSKAFCCSLSHEELITRNHLGAIHWIERFQFQNNEKGEPLPEVLSRSNMKWYEMRDTSTAEMCLSINPDKRIIISRFGRPELINQRLIGINRKNDSTDMDLCHALLNSLLSQFFVEGIGFPRGLGALDINSTKFGLSYMLNPDLLNRNQRDRIVAGFQPLLQRDILSSKDELLLSDRIQFEQIVLEEYHLLQYYDDIKQSIFSMQMVRDICANRIH